MKKIVKALCALAAIGMLGSCASLKPFSQDEINRLSYAAAEVSVA